MLASGVTLPMEQLRAAESMAAAQANPRPPLHIRLASIDGKPVTTHTGISLVPDCALGEVDNSSLTYLPALWRNPRVQIKHNLDLLPWLRRQHALGNTIAGVGTGCCFMAEAGLLDGRAATTHWHYFDQFAKAYPKVNLKRDYFITQADNLFCTGSVNSTADLTIYFIQRAFSPLIASHVERHFFHEIRKAFNHTDSSVNFKHPDENIAQAQAWLAEKCTQPISIADAATAHGMSLRSFNRRFKIATNQTPLQYLQQIRILMAKDLLQTSNLSVSDIAYNTGYQDE